MNKKNTWLTCEMKGKNNFLNSKVSTKIFFFQKFSTEKMMGRENIFRFLNFFYIYFPQVCIIYNFYNYGLY